MWLELAPRSRYFYSLLPCVAKPTLTDLYLRCALFIAFDSQEAIFRVVAAVLHLGNIEFTKGKEMDSSEPKDEKSLFHLQTAAELFM